MVGLKQIHLKPEYKFLSSIYRNAECHERYIITVHPGMPENFIASSIEKGNIFSADHDHRALDSLLALNDLLEYSTARARAFINGPVQGPLIIG
jgi:hypothetical protein